MRQGYPVRERQRHRRSFGGTRRADPRIWWWGRTCLVSDSERWLQSEMESVSLVKGVMLELIPWAAGGELRGPLSALVVHVESQNEAVVRAFEQWAEMSWQALCLVQTHPFAGLAAFHARLSHLGYRAIEVDGVRTESGTSAREHVERLGSGYLPLVPLLADGLGCRDPSVVGALAVAASGQPELRTVWQWLDAVGLESYEQLEALLAVDGLPSPKRLMGLVRLSAVIAYARKRDGRCGRDRLASEFRFPSGNYLGKRAKQLTGIPLCWLVQGDLEEAVARLTAAFLENSPPDEENWP